MMCSISGSSQPTISGKAADSFWLGNIGTMPATQKQWIKLLQRNGWTSERGGKHQIKMTKPGHRPITLPEHKGRAYSKGFEAELRRQAGLQG
jgi:predicted RNA binding protein YcfA (HicA-like mRNA interferase family)